MTDRSSKEVAAAAAETAIVSGSSAATAPLFKFWQQNLFHSRIPAILFDGNCRHASSHRRRWCLSSTCIQKQENDWSSHCQFIPVPVQTIETIEIFTGTQRDEVEIQVVERRFSKQHIKYLDVR